MLQHILYIASISSAQTLSLSSASYRDYSEFMMECKDYVAFVVEGVYTSVNHNYGLDYFRHFFIPRRPEKTRQDPKRPEKTRQDPKRPEKTRKDALIYTEKTRKDALIKARRPGKTRKDPKRPEKTQKDPKRRPKRPKKTRKDPKRPEKTQKDPKRHFYC